MGKGDKSVKTFGWKGSGQVACGDGRTLTVEVEPDEYGSDDFINNSEFYAVDA